MWTQPESAQAQCLLIPASAKVNLSSVLHCGEMLQMLRALLSAVTLLSLVLLVLGSWSGSGASAATWWQHEQEEEEDFEYDFGGVNVFS